MQKIAFVEGNRAINKNNVRRHIESLKKFGRNLVPLLYVEAEEVKGHTLYDAVSEERTVIKPEDYKDYWVILDGQHRYKAAVELANSEEANGFTLDALTWQKVQLNGRSFEDVMIEVNTRTTPWKGSDYICGCILHEPENEAFQFANSLINLGVSGKTVAKYLFFKDKFKWSEAMADAEKMKSADVSRAKKIWEVVKRFPQNMQNKSIIIDYVIDKGGTRHWDVELKKIDALTDEQKRSFEKSKAINMKRQFEEMLG